MSKPPALIQSLVELRQFAQVAHAGSFSDAARTLRQTTAALSAGVKRLEASIGVRLLERSTRSVRVTQEGQLFLLSCRKILSELDLATDAARGSKAELQGHLCIAAPSDLARTLLNQWVGEFSKIHPQIRFDIHVGDDLVDLQKSAIDLAIRFGVPADSSLVARPLSHSRRLACASPDYLHRHGTPKHPYDLENHRCLCFRVNRQLDDRWRFYQGEREHTVHVRVALSSDDSSLARQWAIEGKGVVYKSELDVRADIQAGRLVPLLPDYQGQASPLYVLYPSRENLPGRTTAFISFVLRSMAED